MTRIIVPDRPYRSALAVWTLVAGIVLAATVLLLFGGDRPAARRIPIPAATPASASSWRFPDHASRYGDRIALTVGGVR